MPDLQPLLQLAIILAAMVACATVLIRLGIGPILGYLVAGLLIGPGGLGLVERSPTTDILGELGVVFLLFAIGLELPIKRIQTIGLKILAMGLLQVVTTAGLVTWVVLEMGGALPTGLAIGAGLALSSTTIVLRQLNDRGQLTTRSGRAVFAVLMVQDLLVGPLLVTILALTDDTSNLAVVLSFAFLKAAAAVAAILFLGNRLLALLFQPIAATGSAELFTGFSFLVVVGVGFLTHEAGLSLAFGGFLAGVLLADTHYRHQVAADIRPLRGLLLGIFFASVGMYLDPRVLIETPFATLALTLGLMLGKAVIIVLLSLAFRVDWATSWRTGILLSQGGEFAFVLWAVAGEAGVLPPELARLLIVVVAITMAVTPMLFELVERLSRSQDAQIPLDNPHGERLSQHVVLIGCGWVGGQVMKELVERGVSVAALDCDAEKVRRLRKSHEFVFYGDATQPELLDALHVDDARAVIIAVDDPAEARQVVGLLRYIFDDLPILVRVPDESYAGEMKQAGATSVVPEVIDTGRHLVAALMVERRGDGAAATPP